MTITEQTTTTQFSCVMSRRKNFNQKFYNYTIDGNYLKESSMCKVEKRETLYDLGRILLNNLPGSSLDVEVDIVYLSKKITLRAISDKDKTKFLESVGSAMLQIKEATILKRQASTCYSIISYQSTSSTSSSSSSISTTSTILDSQDLGQVGKKTLTDVLEQNKINEPLLFNQKDHYQVMCDLPDLETFVDSVAVGSLMGDIVSCNSNCAKLFGYDSADHMKGIQIACLMPEPYKSQHDSYLFRYEKHGVEKLIGKSRILQGERKNGQVFDLKMTLAKLSRYGYFLAVFEQPA